MIVEFNYGSEIMYIRFPDGRIMEVRAEGKVEMYTQDHTTTMIFDLPPRSDWNEIIPGHHRCKIVADQG